MIFVILGTQDKPFARLIKDIEQLKKLSIVDEEIIVQSGTTKYESDVLTIVPFMDMQHFQDNIINAHYIISHGGVGTIMTCLNNNKKVIAYPRLQKYGEHENDHQLQIVQPFVDSGYILGCLENQKLSEIVAQIDLFTPKKWQGNKQALIEDIKKELQL